MKYIHKHTQKFDKPLHRRICDLLKEYFPKVYRVTQIDKKNFSPTQPEWVGLGYGPKKYKARIYWAWIKT